jgi:hypothetical protein
MKKTLIAAAAAAAIAFAPLLAAPAHAIPAPGSNCDPAVLWGQAFVNCLFAEQGRTAPPVGATDPACAQYTLPSDIEACTDIHAGATPGPGARPYLPPALGGTG